MADESVQKLMEVAHHTLMRGQGDTPQHARAFLAQRGITSETIEKFKLGVSDEHGGSIVLPYLNPDGPPRFLRYRPLSGTPKYLTPSGRGVHLYNVARTSEREVWLTEGEFDALCLEQLGFPAVGVPGTNSFRREWRFLFAQTDRLTIVFDPDGPGQEAAEKVASMVGYLVEDLRIITLLGGRDVSEWYVADREKLRAMVR